MSSKVKGGLAVLAVCAESGTNRAEASKMFVKTMAVRTQLRILPPKRASQSKTLFDRRASAREGSTLISNSNPQSASKVLRTLRTFTMHRTLSRWAGVVLFAVLSPAWLLAQTNCEEGNSQLNPAQPQNMSPQDIIQKFAAKEAVFKEARNNYTYTQDITVQTLDGNTVDGEYRQIWDITYDDKGGRVEQVKFAPQETLTRIQMTREDFDDFRNRLPFVLTTEDLPIYDIIYVGKQHVDEIDTYVNDVVDRQVLGG